MKKVKIIFAILCFIASVINSITASAIVNSIYGRIYEWYYKRFNNIYVIIFGSMITCVLIGAPVMILMGACEGKIINKIINHFTKA